MKELLEFQNGQSTSMLQDAFIESLDERLEYIDFSWKTLLESSNQKSQMTDFVGAVHYLAGGAGVHGFISLSQRSHQIIGHLRPSILNNTALPTDTRFMVDHLVSSLFSLKKHYDENGYQEPTPEKPAVSQDALESTDSNDIFILEESPDEKRTLKVFLENANMGVTLFTSLHKLQRAINKSAPQAVIIDLQQSSQDPTASNFITAMQKQQPPFPVIALSDTGDIQARIKAARMGATHFFNKPVDGYKLVDTLYKTSSESHLLQRVLLVDDDPETSQYVAAHLRLEGLEVQVINDPLSLLETMAQFHPDLVLTDLYMPECNGLELATIIRQHEVYFDIPIVFLTSETDESSRLAALQLGSDDFFSKSADVHLVAKAVKSRLERMSSYALIKKAMIWSPN